MSSCWSRDSADFFGFNEKKTTSIYYLNKYFFLTVHMSPSTWEMHMEVKYWKVITRWAWRMFDYYPEPMQNIPMGTYAHMCPPASLEGRSCLQVCVSTNQGRKCHCSEAASCLVTAARKSVTCTNTYRSCGCCGNVRQHPRNLHLIYFFIHY